MKRLLALLFFLSSSAYAGNSAISSPVSIQVAASSAFINVRDYGAKGDAQTVNDGAITAGINILSSTSATFTVADVGKTCFVRGAGISGVTLATTISRFSNIHAVT